MVVKAEGPRRSKTTTAASSNRVPTQFKSGTLELKQHLR
jgi:hypothetical protein